MRRSLLFCGVRGFVGAKFGLGHAGTFTILFWRYLLVTAILTLFVTLARQWQRIPRSVIGRHMLIGALAHAGWLVAVLGAIDLGLSAGLAAFITALQPILTSALSARMTGERVSGKEWAGLGTGSCRRGVGYRRWNCPWGAQLSRICFLS